MKPRYTGLLGGIWSVLGAVAFFSAFLNLLTLTVPLYMLQIYDRVIATGSMPTLTMLTIIAVGCLLIYTGFEVVRGRLVSRASARLEYTAGPLALEASVSAAMRRGSPKLAQPLRDLQEVRGFIASPGFLAFLDAPWVPAYTALIFLMHPLLGLVALLGALALAGIGVASEMIGRDLQREARETSMQAGRRMEGYVRHSDVIQSMGLLPAIKARYLADVGTAFRPMGLSADRSVLMAGLAKLVRAMLQVALLAVGVVLVLRQQLTAGQMVAASVLSARAFAPLEQSIGAWRSLVSARAAFARLKEAVLSVSRGNERIELPEPTGRITLEDVTVTAEGRQRPLLDGVNLEVRPGEVIAVTGPSGAGKSTLARVIAGLEKPSQGVVRFDGASIDDWPPGQLGNAIGYLPQQAALFPGSIAENIAGLEPEPDSALVTEAAMATGAHELILGLPGGYNAEVGWDGEMLSAGQRQRVGLARAFHGGRRIIVLDEPNANLDVAGDAALAGAIGWARQNQCTVVLATHRREILGKVDRIVMLEDGRLTRIGRPGPTLVNGGKRVPEVAPAKSVRSAGRHPPSRPAANGTTETDADFDAMVQALRRIR